MAKLLDDIFVQRTLEAHGKTGKRFDRHPSPCIELRVAIGREIDVAVPAGEPEREPTLFLAAIPAAPCAPKEVFRKFIAIPLLRLGNDFGLVRADLLGQLAQHRLARLLGAVDPALWQLPGVARRVDAAGNEDQSLAIDLHRSDAFSVWQLPPLCVHRAPSVASNAETGAST